MDKKTTVNCQICGKEIVCERPERKMYCQPCKDYKNKTVKAHGGFKVVNEIYERDHFRCTLCGITEEEHKRERNRRLIIHHKNSKTKENTVENQELLCVSCHNKVHGNMRKWKIELDHSIILYKEIFMRCAHQLKDGYVGKCKNIHGEYYKICLWVTGKIVDKYGMLVDFGHLKKLTHGKYDHKFLNEIPPFDKINPTCENICRVLYYDINEDLNKFNNKPSLLKIRVYESDTSYAEFGYKDD